MCSLIFPRENANGRGAWYRLYKHRVYEIYSFIGTRWNRIFFLFHLVNGQYVRAGQLRVGDRVEDLLFVIQHSEVVQRPGDDENCSRYVISWDEGVPVGNVKPGIGRVIAVVAHHKVLSFGYRHLKGNV